MAVQVYTSVQLEPVTCFRCAVIFGLPSDMYKNRLADQTDWYCPNGHAQRFVGETEAEKYKRLWKQEQDLAASLRGNLDQAERSASAFKGQATRLRNRAIVGTCAFCHRHFQNVERHVASQHPEEKP